MKYRFRSNEEKWTKVVDVSDRKMAEFNDEILEVKEMLDEMAAMGALVTSIDKDTGETLYRYDNTNPRAQAIMTALGSHEVTRVLQ